MMNPLDMMDRDKQAEVIALLLEFMEQAAKRRDGIEKAMAALDGEPNQATIAKFLRTTMKIVKEQDAAVANVAQIAIIYLGGETFTTDAAKVANKLGQGEAALRKMFENKLKGR